MYDVAEYILFCFLGNKINLDQNLLFIKKIITKNF